MVHKESKPKFTVSCKGFQIRGDYSSDSRTNSL